MKNEEIKFRLIKPILSREVFENVKKLYRKDDVKREIINHYFQKLRICASIILATTILAILIKISGTETQIRDGKVKRNNSGGISKTVDVSIYSNDEKICDETLEIASKKYTDEELEKFYSLFENRIKNDIRGKNKSLDYVTDNLNFKSKIEELPFKISYKTSAPLVISSDGKIKQENVENGQIIEINITAKYENFEETEIVYVQVFKKKKNSSELFADEIKSAIEKNDEITKNDDYFILPARVDGKTVYYKEIGKGRSALLFTLGLIAALLIYFGKDKELNDRTRLLKNEMDLEYSLLVNKFALFYNANMPIKKIWKKICSDYEEEKKKTKVTKYVYEEMIYVNNLMNEGMSEIRAYEEFAKRCSTHKYRIFINTLEQAVTKGKKDMSKILINEAREAFIEKKNNAKRLGEEAGTKLLIPMFMMLMIVMVMIIFPAFYSFKM